jgi:hypothetical protein
VVRRFQVLAFKRIQTGHEDVVKVLLKSIEDEGKAPQEKTVGSRQIA